MNDCKGKPISIGDRVFVLPHKGSDVQGAGYVRAFTPRDGGMARVDDGAADAASSIVDREDWTWSTWVSPAEVEKL